MAERIARPPIRLGAGLPDGQLLGATDKDIQGLLVENPEGDVIDRYAIVRLIRRQTTHSDESGADTAVLRVAAIELFPDDVIQPLAERLPAGQWMAQLRAERLGENTLDFAGAAAAESLSELLRRVELWAGQSEVPADELPTEIRKAVPNVPDGVDVLRDVKVLSEFLVVIREREDDEFDAAVGVVEASTGPAKKRPKGKPAPAVTSFSDEPDPAEPAVEPAAE